MDKRSVGSKTLVSVVIPVFNEAGILQELYRGLKDVLGRIGCAYEIIFINDGSGDGSLTAMLSLHDRDKNVKVVNLSRNFGHQNALMAGVDCAVGDAVVLMDADMEDDPKYVASFIDKWCQGYDVVYALRTKRKDTLVRKLGFQLFHALNRMVSNIDIDATGSFCLMDKKIAGYLRRLTERDMYIPGLRKWIGFNQIGIEIPRNRRYDNSPRVKIRHLFKLAFDSFTSFSTLPLKMSIFLGILFSLASFAGIIFVVILKLFFNVAMLGWTSLVSIILLVGGVQLICIGLQGEYISRIFNEVKNRPHYIVNDKIGFGA
jgi:dolichol-phosphate mannosyltransferase